MRCYVKRDFRVLLALGNDHWSESSGLGNVVDFWLATLPMALPPKIIHPVLF